MKTALKSISTAAIFAIAAVPAMAIPTTISFTVPPQTGGNKGVSYKPSGADFTVTARWGLSGVNDGANPGYVNNPGTGFFDASGNPLTSPTPGLVFQDQNGLGVWANRYEKDKKGNLKLDGGSDAISGGGPHGKEELIFTFDNPVLLDSVSVGLIMLNLEKGKNPTEWTDDPVLYITGSAGTEVGISEATLFAILGPVTSGILNFSSLSQFSDPNSTVSYFRVRNLQDHFEVSSLSYEPPSSQVPDGGSTAALLGLSVIAFGALRHRKRA
jgi:hypothetical protein